MSELAVQFVLSATVGLGAFVFFSFMLPRNKPVYQPNKVYSSTISKRLSMPFLNASAIPRHLPDLPETMFGWVPVVWRATERQLMDSLGLDAVMFVKLAETLLKCVSGALVLGIVLFIINYLAPSLSIYTGVALNGSKPSSYTTTRVIYWTPNLVWIHVTAAFLMTGLFLYMFNKVWLDFVRLRQEYFHSPEYYNSACAKTILVTNLKPSMLKDDYALADAMAEVNVIHFSSATLGKKVDKLQDLVAKREEYVRQLEVLVQRRFRNQIGVYKPDADSSEELTGVSMPAEGVKVINKIKDLEGQIHALRRGGALEFKNLYAGFVDFERPEEAHDVVEQLRGRAMDLKIEPAPQPSDIIWANLGVAPVVLRHRRWMGSLLTMAVVLGWTIPLSALVFIAQVQFITRLFPSTAVFFQSHPAAGNFLHSYLVPVLLNIFLAVAPLLFRWIVTLQGAYTIPHKTKASFHKLFLFYLVGFFCLFTIVGTVITAFSSNNLKAFGDAFRQKDPGNGVVKFLNQLALQAANVATAYADKAWFWINYVSLGSLGVLPLDLARAAPLARALFRRTFSTMTPREYINITTPPNFDYDIVVTQLLFQAFIAMMYAWVHPLILIMSCFYFLIAYVVFKYQVMYIYTTSSQSGGALFPTVYKRIVSILLAAQAVFILFLLSSNYAQLWPQSVAMLVLFIATAVAGRKTFKKHIKRAMYIQEGAGAAGKGDSGLVLPAGMLNPAARRRYLHPALVSRLILPMIDPRVEYILEPYFPEITKPETRTRNRNSLDSISSSFNDGMGKPQLPDFAREDGRFKNASNPSSPSMGPNAYSPAFEDDLVHGRRPSYDRTLQPGPMSPTLANQYSSPLSPPRPEPRRIGNSPLGAGYANPAQSSPMMRPQQQQPPYQQSYAMQPLGNMSPATRPQPQQQQQQQQPYYLPSPQLPYRQQPGQNERSGSFSQASSVRAPYGSQASVDNTPTASPVMQGSQPRYTPQQQQQQHQQHQHQAQYSADTAASRTHGTMDSTRQYYTASHE
ncbi:hypothetical protein RI367_000059 [Sorochytrium milnesiophthora]